MYQLRTPPVHALAGFVRVSASKSKMKYMLAQKLGMTQVFDEEGKVHPVTVLKAGPMKVIQIKTKARDGYDAVQVGFGKKSAKRMTNPLKGHLKKAGIEYGVRWLREFRGKSPFKIGDKEIAVGDEVRVSVFAKGDKVDVVGISKGRGFQGVVKRHGFGGGPSTHGTKHSHRAPGSIGATHPQHVIKGRKMAGHMGAKRVTVKNLKVAGVDPEKNELLIEGAVPGARGSLVIVRGVK